MDKIIKLKEILDNLLMNNNSQKDEIVKVSQELDEHIVLEQRRRLKLLASKEK